MRRLPVWVRRPQLLITSPYYATLGSGIIALLASLWVPDPWGYMLLFLSIFQFIANRAWVNRFELFGMGRRDRLAWATPTTMAGVAKLTASWLGWGDSTIFSRLGYTPGLGPDSETYEILDELIALNLTGAILTDNSQPARSVVLNDGCCEDCDCHPQDDRWVLEQRAAVTGFADPDMVAKLHMMATEFELKLIVHVPSYTAGRDYTNAVPVTRVRCLDNDNLTRNECVYGVRVAVPELRRRWFGLHPEALAEIEQAVQFTLVDMRWGSEDDRLWRALTSYFVHPVAEVQA